MISATPHPSDTLEVEFKFELSPDAVRRLLRSTPFKTMQTAKPTRQSLRATYFDTPDLKLSQRGVSLRVRKEGRRFVQCVKSAAEGAEHDGFARREWQWPIVGGVAGGVLDPALLKSDAALKALFKGIAVKKLRPIFTTEIQRQSRLLTTPGGARVSCDIDQGRIVSGAFETPVYELELELLSGPVDELLALARVVTDAVPARLSARTKAHRGFRLYAQQGQPWVRAEALALPQHPSGEDVLRAAMQAGLTHLIGNEDCVLTRGDAEGVHQMRVAMRRMRSLISTFKKQLPQGGDEGLAESLNAAAGELGPARDWDVFVDELLPPVEAGTINASALALLRTRAEQRRRAGYQRADHLIASAAYARLLTDVQCWIGNRTWRDDASAAARLDQPAPTIAAEVLARRHAHLLKTGKGLKDLSAEHRHRLRIAVKKTRYAASFFAPLYAAKKTEPYVAALRTLQDFLGHMNDLTTAQRMMADLIRSTRKENAQTLIAAAGMVEGWYAHAQAAREKELRKAWKAFTKVKVFW